MLTPQNITITYSDYFTECTVRKYKEYRKMIHIDYRLTVDCT